MVIGVSGVARSGKDTFYLLLKQRLQPLGFVCARTAFADKLKSDLKPLILKEFSIDIDNCTDSEKEIIRPFMVSYGTLARSLNQDHWVNKVKNKIFKEQLKPKTISVITDVRYPNEQSFIKTNFKKFCNVHIERFGRGPANEEEKKYDPDLKKQSNYLIYWKDFDDSIEEGEPIIDGFINEKIRM
jgi:hypothetical protein